MIGHSSKKTKNNHPPGNCPVFFALAFDDRPGLLIVTDISPKPGNCPAGGYFSSFFFPSVGVSSKKFHGLSRVCTHSVGNNHPPGNCPVFFALAFDDRPGLLIVTDISPA
jgi:hypothetical protein